MAGSGGGKGTGKGGSSGHASNAALDDNEDLMARRRAVFGKWKSNRKPRPMLEYLNSPTPPMPKKSS